MEIQHITKRSTDFGVILSIMFFFFLPTLALADTYIPLVKGLPTVTESSDLNQYINAIYILSISVAALLAVIKIIFAGAKYMLTDITPTKGEAKKDIWGALIGLLIVLSAVLILNTINDKLTNFDIFNNAPNILINKNFSISDTDYYSSITISPNSDSGTPTLNDWSNLPGSVVKDFINSCEDNGGIIIKSGSGSMTCRGNTSTADNNLVNTSDLIDLIPSGTDPKQADVLNNQFYNYVAPYEPKDINIAQIKSQTGANNVLFVVQQDLMNTPSASGAESQQEAFCIAIGGEIVQGGSAYRACVN